VSNCLSSALCLLNAGSLQSPVKTLSQNHNYFRICRYLCSLLISCNVKETVLIGLMLCIFSVTLAQTKEKIDAKARITGTVVDSLSNLPLEYATITLIKNGEKKRVQWRHVG
jgi:hypothetical protein